MEKCGLIRKSQHGILNGKSCLTNLLKFFEVDEGNAVDMVYMDFQEAFERMPQQTCEKSYRNHRNPTVQKEAIWPIESAPTTIPPRPYPHIPTYLPANPSNLRISGL